MFVLTIDQRNSQGSEDKVPQLLAALADLPMLLAFERSVGDEIQGVCDSARTATDAVLRVLRDGDWYVGVGVGGVHEPLPASPRAAGGPAFVAARRAVDRAKKSGDRPPVAVEGSPGAPEAEAVLVLLGRLIAERTDAEWRILQHVDPGKWGSQTAAARKLGISSQAVSKAARRGGWQEEWAARPAAAVLLERADDLAGGTGPAQRRTDQ
ncbi:MULTISPECIES: helix-turn-helix domain-containing protein [unclassified Arthrobacter]|uniref:MarR family transcriptional regulator n=1 Tax=unclassified Arthrobacter TaxID=235627 RepID=UPI002107150D|nr:MULTISPECIES: helix-turn-helix domain-containing protein [unclassified Arthrobacter]MCQ1947994.1 MarR family transcriptional regulator [Arthrobacter sp. zg-Y1116]MCQ1987933.1 MarR family transcriptional regulator [Arthrobacter sp. zg-Y844]MCQ1996100.1 MarR family transcriptional regulator [Arthrobacter sp. zg-Y1171]UWX82834.1 MarR family transcriptional regulator [Arthrobacter sp. zg-Y1171]